MNPSHAVEMGYLFNKQCWTALSEDKDTPDP